MYIKSKPKLIVQLLSHMYFYTERKTPSGRAEEGGCERRFVNFHCNYYEVIEQDNVVNSIFVRASLSTKQSK